MAPKQRPGTAGTVHEALGLVQATPLNNQEPNPPPEKFQRLGDVTAQVVAQLRVHLYSDGSFDYGPDGVLASVLPVPGLDGRMEDIVAWGDDPDRWWLRRRWAVILGMDAVEWADYLQEPLTLLETPAEWVEAGRRGACILNWKACLPLYFPQVSTIECTSERLARRLRKAMALTPPNVKVRGPN